MAFPPTPIITEEKIYTREDLRHLESLPENADKIFELINGRLYITETVGGKMPTPSYLHALVVSMLVEILMEFLLTHKIGRLFPDNTGYDLPNGSTLIPDLSFVAADRLLPAMITGNQYIAPDLAVEVVSPSNTPEELSDKVNAYLSAGVKLVWVVYPRTRSIDIYTPQGDGLIQYQKLSAQDTLTGGTVLTGFTVPVDKIFPAIKPAVS